MKKLYRRGMVHPSPPVISDHLAFLPATILTLAAALSPEDREVLAYLVSCSSGNFSGNRRSTQKASAAAGLGSGKGGDHPPSFNCDCFRCYTSYWVRWDSSPSRQLIHEIIDAFEDGLLAQSKKLDKNNKRKKKKDESARSELTRSELSSNKGELGDSKSVEEASLGGGGGGSGGGDGEDSGGVGAGAGAGAGDEGGETEKGSVRKFVSFLGEKFWSVWN